jgi:hypothetical protein
MWSKANIAPSKRWQPTGSYNTEHRKSNLEKNGRGQDLARFLGSQPAEGKNRE